jgi:ubiquinol-cytochrome c reductase iron-sulfur subunit
VAQDTLIEERPNLEPSPDAEEVAEIVERGGAGITRKRMLATSAGAAGVALGAAFIVPAASLGPWVGDATVQSPWRRGRRLVDEQGTPVPASAVAMGGFVTAFAEGVDKEALGSSLIVVRIDPASVAVRRDWAPQGIMAYSKICTHAGCAVAMMRYPLFSGNAPGPALVCPCHYSTFDITHGARVVFGPAGRPLPQLPLQIDASGYLVADGPLSGDVGPSWTGVDRGSA